MTMQDDQRLTHDCCQEAEALHSASVVMRDFRLPNIVTRNGVEGDSVVIKLESAEPDKHLWLIEPLQDWDDQTLNQDRRCNSCSDMYHISNLIEALPFWRTSAQPL